MGPGVVLLQLVLWVSLASAFFPYVPEYRCEEDPTCKTAKRSQVGGRSGLEGRTSEAPEAVTFELTQRVPRVPVPQGIRISQDVRRLARKYAAKTQSEAAPELAKRQNQYSVVVPAAPTQANAAGVYQDGTDFSYFVQVKLGAKEKPLYMLIDTGAGTTWVMGSTCTTAACTMHDSFGPADSTSLQVSQKTFQVNYGSGSVGGFLATDSVSLAGMKVQYEFGLANTTSEDFVHFPFDGILGLSMSVGQSKNYLQALKESKLLPANVFGVYLSRAADGGNNGEISFGAPNPAKYTGEVKYTPVSPAAGGDWAVPLDGLAIDGKDTPDIKGKLAYLDTGTSYIFGTKTGVEAFHKLVPGATTADGLTYSVPCDTKLAASFKFSGVSYSIPARDWVSAPSSSGACTSNIYGHEVVAGGWLLGDLFLKNVYAIFDADKSQIGLANRPPVPKSETTKTVSSTAPPSSPVPPEGTTLTTVTTPVPTTGSSTPPAVGLSGHETSGATGAVSTDSVAAIPTQSSPGEQLQGSYFATIVVVMVAVVMAA